MNHYEHKEALAALDFVEQAEDAISGLHQEQFRRSAEMVRSHIKELARLVAALEAKDGD